MVEPDRGPELSAYREMIQKAARTHQWEFVIKYDRHFRKAAVDRSKFWVRVDSSLFMQELAGPQAAFLAAGAWTPSRGLNTLAPGKSQGTRALGVTREAQTGGRGMGHATSSIGRMECAPMGLCASSATRVPDAGGCTLVQGAMGVEEWSGWWDRARLGTKCWWSTFLERELNLGGRVSLSSSTHYFILHVS